MRMRRKPLIGWANVIAVLTTVLVLASFAPALAASPPKIVSCYPGSVYQGEEALALVKGKGTHFLGNSNVYVSGTGVRGEMAQLYSDSEALIRLHIDGNAAPGTRDLTMITSQFGETPVPLEGGIRVLPGAYTNIGSTPAGGNNSSPCEADVDADGREELLIGWGSVLYCFDCAGGLRWNRETSGRVASSPAAWDMNGDGRMEIFVGNEAALVWGFDCNGNNLPGWPRNLPPARACEQAGCFSSPAIGDINGDGAMEIVIGCWGMYVWAFNWQGSVIPGFPVDVKDTIWSSPALGDVNGDGIDEIVIGADCTAGQGWPYPSGGLVFCLNGSGQNLPGWPRWTPQVVWSSPALGDLNGDGRLEIAVGNGYYYNGVPYYLSAWDWAGNPLPGWPIDHKTMSSPAIGDLNGDGRLDVSFGSDLNMDCGGKQVNVKPQAWPGEVWSGGLSSPALGDLDGDGKIGVIGSWYSNTAAVGDFDKDGLVEYFCHGEVEQTKTKYNPALYPWPQFRHDCRHTGCFGNPKPRPPRPNFETYVLLQNPADEEATVTLTYMVQGGDNESEKVTLAGNSRKTVCVNDSVGFGKSVSTRVSSSKPIMAERAVYFNSGGRAGGSDSIGAEKPARQWYFAEGYTGGEFDTWVLVQNPGDAETNVLVSLMKGDGTVVPVGFVMAPRSRFSLHLDDVPGCESCELSATIAASAEVVAERAMYFSYSGMAGGHDSVGVTESSKTWYFAEGCTDWGFDTYVLVQNPGDEASDVTLTFMREDGQEFEYASRLAPHSRHTVIPRNIPGLEKANFSTRVIGSRPVCAERAMYFDNNGRRGGTCSIGSSSQSERWYLAEGFTAESFDTWVTIQNPGSKASAIKATFMKQKGANVVTGYRVAPHSRLTIPVDSIPGLEATEVSTRLESTNGVPFIAERSMYFIHKGLWDGGHNTVGAKEPSETWYFAEGYTGL